MNKNVVLVTGGTGGHIIPAIALYEALIVNNFGAALLVDKRFLNFQKYIANNAKYKVIISDKLSGGIISKLFGIIRLFIGLLQSIFWLTKLNPAVVIGFGGYTTFPTMIAAKILRKKIILHEQNSVIGNANKFLAPYADLIATTFPDVKNIDNKKDVLFTGNFIRNSLWKNRKNIYPKLNKNENETIKITIIGGSQGAAILSKVIPEAIIKFSEKSGYKFIIYQQARAEDIEKVKKQYEQARIESFIAPFFPNIEKKMMDSHLVIARSGASTITDLITIGRPAIFIPFPGSFGDHQYYNAEYIVKNQGGWLIDQANFNQNSLCDLLNEILNHPKILLKYAKNTKKLARNGIEIILPVIEKLCAK